eukprot:Filipodium_phascolosomae@DN1357_c0_g1_i1.p1
MGKRGSGGSSVSEEREDSAEEVSELKNLIEESLSEDGESEGEEAQAKRRGRPKKKASAKKKSVSPDADATPKKRGRPPSLHPKKSSDDDTPKVKLPRGRPSRAKDLPDLEIPENIEEVFSAGKPILRKRINKITIKGYPKNQAEINAAKTAASFAKMTTPKNVIEQGKESDWKEYWDAALDLMREEWPAQKRGRPRAASD